MRGGVDGATTSFEEGESSDAADPRGDVAWEVRTCSSSSWGLANFSVRSRHRLLRVPELRNLNGSPNMFSPSKPPNCAPALRLSNLEQRSSGTGTYCGSASSGHPIPGGDPKAPIGLGTRLLQVAIVLGVFAIEVAGVFIRPCGGVQGSAAAFLPGSGTGLSKGS